MVGLIKRVWQDPVWSKVIAAAILYGGSLLMRHWPANLLSRGAVCLSAVPEGLASRDTEAPAGPQCRTEHP